MNGYFTHFDQISPIKKSNSSQRSNNVEVDYILFFKLPEGVDLPVHPCDDEVEAYKYVDTEQKTGNVIIEINS